MAVSLDGARSVFIDNQYLSRFNVSYKLRPDCIKRTAFRSYDIAAVCSLAVAKRSEASLVPHGYELAG